MQEKCHYRSDKDFLGDKNFVNWQLTKHEELDEYWGQFIQENPHLQDQFDLACSFFDKIKLHKESMHQEDKELLLVSIKNSVYKTRIRNKRRKHALVSLAVAGLAVALILSPIYNKKNYSEENKLIVEVETTEMSAEDIYIITPSGATLVQNNANIQIQKNSIAVHEEGDNTQNKLLELDDNQSNKIIVPYGKRTKLTLSDGTSIWLNAGSTLEFPSQFTGNSREIYLTGEIYADVAKGKTPFIIHTSKFDIKVYGTKLNIAAYENSENFIVLESGSLGVTPLEAEEVRLAPKEMLILGNDGQTSKVTGVNVREFTSWKDNYLLLNNTSMLKVLSQIERYYNLSFKYNNNDHAKLKDKTCTGRIILSENIDNVLATFALLSYAKYEKENQKILINVEP